MVSNENGSVSDEILGASDDESFKSLNQDGKWEPEPEEIILLYEELNNKSTLAYEWQNVGRRPPTPDIVKELNEEHEANEAIMNTATEFDFEDEMSQLKLTVRQPGDCTPKGSAKKATTSLDSILSNMARHRKLELMEKDLD